MDKNVPVVFRGGAWHVRVNRYSSGRSGQTECFYYGNPDDIPVIGDWDGDGTDSPGIFRPSEGRWFLRNGDGGGPPSAIIQFGMPGDIPVVGDWNNDGRSGLGVFRNGTWYLLNNYASSGIHNGGIADAPFAYGSPGDVPVVGDWNADGTDTLGVFRGGLWYLTNDFNSKVAQGVARFGSSGDIPVVGDWNGDRTDTLGFVRDGQWNLSNFHGGPVEGVFEHGQKGDRFLVAL